MNSVWEKYKQARRKAITTKAANKKAKKKLKYFYDTLLQCSCKSTHDNTTRST